MDPIIGSAIVSLIQIAAEYAEKYGMDKAAATQHFLDSYDLAKQNDPNKLPDAKLPDQP